MQAPGLSVKQLAQQALTSIKADLQARQFEQARTRLEEVATWARQNTSLLSPQQQAWVARHKWVLAPLWSEPVQHGVVSLRRCGANDAEFFRAVFQDTAFTNRFNRQQPWSGDLGRALHKFGHEPPALLKMLQWVVCLRSEPVGLISLSHLDLTNARAEFSIGFPKDMTAGISHKACLLAMHFSFFVAGLHRLYGHVYEGNDPALQAAARAIALIYTLTALSLLARDQRWVRPRFVPQPCIEIQRGRHPVVEAQLAQSSGSAFVPNDCRLDPNRRLLLITGPNMGGKSTYMRQVALITLLAYVGCYVPAGSAVLGPIDAIFTRIGAADDLAQGRSTFMVEMTETAAILNNASDKSLVIMDEVGRGTSTFDGMALASSIAQTLASKNRSLSLFATHYFALTALAHELPAAANVHVTATEHRGGIVFLHALEEGAASKSYGIQVAKLAGVPEPTVQLARRLLSQLESNTRATAPQLGLFDSTPVPEEKIPSLIEEKLAQVDIDALTPREAQVLLYELAALLKK